VDGLRKSKNPVKLHNKADTSTSGVHEVRIPSIGMSDRNSRRHSQGLSDSNWDEGAELTLLLNDRPVAKDSSRAPPTGNDLVKFGGYKLFHNITSMLKQLEQVPVTIHTESSSLTNLLTGTIDPHGHNCFSQSEITNNASSPIGHRFIEPKHTFPGLAVSPFDYEQRAAYTKCRNTALRFQFTRK
jgi:hypothetical protein